MTDEFAIKTLKNETEPETVQIIDYKTIILDKLIGAPAQRSTSRRRDRSSSFITA
jgi:hypothetical protein